MKKSTFSPVREVDELLAAIPAVLGYRPSESAVLAVCVDKVLCFAARFDIDWFLMDSDAVALPLIQALERYPGDCFLLGYSQDEAMAKMSLLELSALVGGDRVLEIAFTNGKRWWSLTCPGDCCPDTGKPFDFDKAKASAEAVFAGLPIGRDRAEVVALVAGASEIEQRVHAGVVHAVRAEIAARPKHDWLGDLLRLRNELCDRPRKLDEVEVARFEVVLDDPEAQIEFMSRISEETAEADFELFVQLVTGCLDRYAAPLLGLLGLACWLAGGGPVLTAAAERLNQLEPTNPLAMLLTSVLTCAVPPSEWRDVGGCRDEAS